MALETLYLQTNKLVQETQHAFERLEKVNGPNIDTIEKDIETKIAAITSNCERLDVLLYKEPVHRRQNAKLKIDQLKYDNQHLRAGFSMYQHRRQERLREEREREELLNTRFAPNSETDTSILIDHSLQHNMSLQNSHRGMDAMLITGTGILENLRDQRTTIKGAQRRLFDIANTLGLSNTTMRYIEKRASQDKLILFGGMLFTCVVMFIVVSYFT